MKSTLAVGLLALLLSCNGDSEKPASSSSSTAKDTNVAQPNTINPYGAVDISPMDVSYYPTDYPVLKMSGKTTAEPVARIIYSRPHRQGRKIFGSLLKYGEPWRLGANEATEIELFQPLRIQNKTVEKGRYIMYCIPTEKTWTIIFNTNNYTWGLKQDPKNDAYRFEVPVQKVITPIENFTIVFQQKTSTPEIVIVWDDTEARLPFTTS
jgi:hypothetical protein